MITSWAAQRKRDETAGIKKDDLAFSLIGLPFISIYILLFRK